MPKPTKKPTYALDDRLTRQEAAAVLGISVSLLAHYRRNGRINQEKHPVTGAVRFVYADLLALKTAREANGTPTTGVQPVKRTRRVPAQAGR
jgi:hypothetical protein